MTQALDVHQLRLLDEHGQVRATLGMDGEAVGLKFHNPAGAVTLKLTSEGSGFSALQLLDPASQTRRIEVSRDDKGTHFMLVGEQKQLGYLFLKNSGATGVVLIDASGARKVEVLLDPDGAAHASLWDQAGNKRSL